MTVLSSLTGSMIPLPGDDIDTDRIVPARFLKEVTFEKMGDYLFYDVRYDERGKPTDFVLNQSAYAEGTILVVGSNFGCGSSREHAPQAIKRYGIRAIVGVSFAEIFASNCLSLGVPVVCLPAQDIDTIFTVIQDQPQIEGHLDLVSKRFSIGDNRFGVDIADARRAAFLDGSWDVLRLLKDNESVIRQKDMDLKARKQV